MKYFYLIIALFFGINTYSQNDLLGEWYLHSITKSGVEEINTFNPTFHINFTLDPIESNLFFNGMAICKDYSGGYNVVDENAFEMINLSFVLSMCQETGGPYEDSYLSFFDEAQTGTMILNYSITGIGDDATLIVTKQNDDFVVYGRQTLSVSDFERNTLSVRLNENPVKNKLSIESNQSSDANLNYQIYDIHGKLMMFDQFSSENAITVSDLKPGLYFVVITSERQYKQTIKFIKK